MVDLHHVLTCEARKGTGIPEGLVLGRVLMEAHFVAAGRFAINLPDAETAPEKGVAWQASPKTGFRLQFFGAQEDLQAIRKPLEVLAEMVDVGRVHEVRSAVRYASCRRVRDAVRTQATIAREIRRAERKAAEKGGKIKKQLRENLLASRRNSRLPYVRLASLSTGDTFCVRFETTVTDTPTLGEFDSYGFGKGATTVPLV
jgi:CRISPR-associated endoribonuclease Cas6/Csy4 subtype I-F